MFDFDLSPLRLSLQVAALATAICLVLGVALAWLLARRQFWGRGVLSALVTLPLVLPPTVLGYYLLQVLGRRSLAGEFLEDTFGLRLAFAWEGAVIASTIVALPLMVRSAQAAFEAVDPSLENTARTLGRTNLAVFFTVTLPLAWPGVVAGTALAFARAVGEFGATIMFAGNIPGQTRTMPVAIYDAWQSGDTALAEHPGGHPHRHLPAQPAGHRPAAARLALVGAPMLEVDIRRRLGGFHLATAFSAGDEIAVLFGPSGAGKSLTLQAIAGILRPDKGLVRVNGLTAFDSAAGINLPPQERRIGYVPQGYALFPHLTVAHNIGYGLSGLDAPPAVAAGAGDDQPPGPGRTGGPPPARALGRPAAAGGAGAGAGLPAPPPPAGRALRRPGRGDPQHAARRSCWTSAGGWR